MVDIPAKTFGVGQAVGVVWLSIGNGAGFAEIKGRNAAFEYSQTSDDIFIPERFCGH
jgi:hypothetical protein